ncbi:MAG: DUF402 domain-containing protein [Chloroflexales bacterium]|nr:DUF402 domain-containing protein [Chloroflexales bacterium]
MTFTIRLLKPLKRITVNYTGELLARDDAHILLRALWHDPPKDLGFVQLVPGDVFYEHFYANRWYNIFEIRAANGALKGWYCNVTRPAVFGNHYVESEDLELDLFVPPDRAAPLVLDEDEFAARKLDQTDPEAHAAAHAALAALVQMATSGQPPFSDEKSSIE